MRNIFVKTLLVAIMLVVGACEKELDISKAQLGNKQISVAAIINNEESVSVFVTTDELILDNEVVETLRNARVELYENDILMELLTLEELADLPIGKFYSAVTPVVGNEYKLVVKDDELGEASAKAKIPEAPTVAFISARDVIVENSFWKRMAFDMTINDPGGTNHYYMTFSIPILLKNELTQEYDTIVDYIYGEITTGTLPNHQIYLRNGLLFTDIDFEGEVKQVSGFVTFFGFSSGTILAPGHDYENLMIDYSTLRLRVSALSEDAYNFHSSYGRQLQSQDNPYSEPNVIFTNVENGTGIFAGENVVTKNMTVQQ